MNDKKRNTTKAEHEKKEETVAQSEKYSTDW
jgi:hypothetical protein